MRSIKQFRKMKKSRKTRKHGKKYSKKIRGGIKENTDTFFSPIPYPPGVKPPKTYPSIKSDFLIEKGKGEEDFIAPKKIPKKQITLMKMTMDPVETPKAVIKKYSGLDKDEADIGFVKNLPEGVTVSQGIDANHEIVKYPDESNNNPKRIPKDSDNDYSQFVELGGKTKKKRRKTSRKRKPNRSAKK